MKKDKMMRRLSALQFAMWEMRIYLDTHPDCPEAEKLFREYQEKYSALKKEYETQFGALTLNGKNSDDWLNDPWPWDADFCDQD